MRTNLTRIQVTDLILPTCAREKDEKVCMSERERERESEREKEIVYQTVRREIYAGPSSLLSVFERSSRN